MQSAKRTGCRQNEEHWRAHLGCEEYFDEPAEVVFYCPRCAEREFSSD